MSDSRNKSFQTADIAIVPGSGMKLHLESMDTKSFIPYLDFLGPNAQTVFTSQDGGYYYNHSTGKVILAFNCRLHQYQGFSPLACVLPVKIARNSGAKTIILTNAAGGLDPDLRAGDFVVLSDQIMFPSIPDLSPLFTPDDIIAAGTPYNSDLNKKLYEIIKSKTGSTRFATYAYMHGPAYETHSEVKFLRSMGADVVGMSTALEASYGHLSGIRVVGMSLVTNIHHQQHIEPLSHEEVLKKAQEKGEIFNRIIQDFIDVI